jgi:DnaJ-class molecular chaperone
MSDDPYAVLGLKKTATAEQIKKAWRKIVRTSHPDLNPDDPKAEARFKALGAAYDLLSDPEKRRRFDAGEIDASGAERPDRTFYRDYAEGPQGGFRSGAYQTGGRFEDFGDPADIFAEILRQRGRGGRTQGQSGQGFAAPGPDLRYSMEVPFLDAARGSKTRITLPDGGNLEVAIPPGTADGHTLRLRGKGGPGFGGGPAGDAYVTLAVRDHPVFRRDGDDIVVTLPITIAEAVLGGKVAAPTIDGPVNLTIPKGASSGQTLRLRGRGVITRSGKRGDQRVELRIVAPPKVDKELEDFMEKWRKSHAHDPRKGMKS